MDNNSQSLDCFPEGADSFFSPVPMETDSYDTLVTKTKDILMSGVSSELQKPKFSTCFAALLDDCYNSITQSLELIVTNLDTELEVSIDKLMEYLNDAVCILQLFSNYIKSVIEMVAMTCCSLKTLPVKTGQIIIIVFTHCKDSELLYGNNLSNVEKLLKDLFRNCHELQLTYLMILERHILFDLTEQAERDILVEALEINLKIGEIVQSLDVKTMAEQWKAFTAICEKYSTILADTSLVQNCMQVLCNLIRINIKTALELNQDDKVVIRSLKVASFTIKILLKTCNIFKHARRDHSGILDLMCFMQVTCYHHTKKAPPTNLLNTNILIPSEGLLKEMLTDEMFVNHLLHRDLEQIKHEATLLGFILTLASAMKCSALGNGMKSAKTQLIDCLYRVLSYYPMWIQLDVRLKSGPNESEYHGLSEHLLIHAAALAFTLNNEEFNTLERNMIEGILGTEYYSAMFSINLWTILARHVNSQLIFNQLIWLCTMYKKLENHKMFYRSPQKIHLSNTISGIFEVMDDDDKVKICKQFRINDDDNTSLWTALTVNNLPDELRFDTEDIVFEKLRNIYHGFINSKGSEGICGLIKLMELAATCAFTNTRGIGDFVVKMCLKTCPKHFSIANIDSSTVWFFDYMKALASLTESVWNRLEENSSNIIKMGHIICSLIQQSSNDVRLLLTNLLCKFATCDILTSQRVVLNFSEAFTSLHDSDELIQNYLLLQLCKYRDDNNIAAILASVEDNSLQGNWANIKNGISCNANKKILKAVDFKYSHKCFENKRTNELSRSHNISNIKKEGSGNFEFSDIENLFDNDSELEQPQCKKAKLNVGETETIIERIETDVSLLYKVKENLFTSDYRNRIQNLSDKLRNIIQ